MQTTKHLAYASDRSCNRFGRLSALAISPSVEDLRFLEGRFKEAHWKLYRAGTYREALSMLNEKRLPVVLSACQLPDGNWKDVLNRLAPMLERPRLIVFSRQADDRLWAEVYNLGGFDLLATPFLEDELMFAIDSAWLDWNRETKAPPAAGVGAHLGAVDPGVGSERPECDPCPIERGYSESD